MSSWHYERKSKVKSGKTQLNLINNVSSPFPCIYSPSREPDFLNQNNKPNLKSITFLSTTVMAATVMSLGAETPVVIFSKTYCCISHSIIILIRKYGANTTIHELDEHPNGQQLERELEALGCKTSTPTVFIGKQLIGGANEVMSLHVKGKLIQLLLEAKAIWV
nr:PREDICTED: monothiol glutaredoxin-S1-like [Daucus carota subsp. sativus]